MLPLAVVVAIRFLTDGNDSSVLALVELATFVILSIAATVLFERTLLREMFSYLRRNATPGVPIV